MLHIDWSETVWDNQFSQNRPWDMYSVCDIPGDFAGAKEIITNLTKKRETGIKISLRRGVPCSFLVPITFKHLLCRLHQDGGNLQRHALFLKCIYSLPYFWLHH